MSLHEAERHAERLGELDPGDLRAALARSPLAACPECRELVELSSRMHALGRHERQAIEAAPQVAEGRAERVLREHVRAAAPETIRVPRSSARRAAPWAVAAAAALVLFLLLRGERPGPLDPGLGEELRLLHPVGKVEAFAPFRWSAAAPGAGWYRIVVQPLASDGRAGEPIDSGRIDGTSWEPSREELERWGSRIRWTLEVYRATGATDLVDSRNASAELSSR